MLPVEAVHSVLAGPARHEAADMRVFRAGDTLISKQRSSTWLNCLV
jgi:hypothetical protein